MRAHLCQHRMRFAACSAPQRYCSAVAHLETVRELAVKFLQQHKAGKTLKLDRAVVAAADDDQHLVEELRAAVWAAARKDRPKVIHGVGHRQTTVVDGVPYTDHNGRVAKEVTHAVEDVSVGGIPFIVSRDVQRGVEDHVRSHAWSGQDTRRVELWCNSGCAGSGKSTLLAHSAAAAVLELEAKVLEAVGSDKAALWLSRPLGFMVTFNSTATPLSGDSAFLESHLTFVAPLILTRIALWMLYSLAGPKKARAMGGPGDGEVEQDVDTKDVEPFTEFVKPFLASSLLRCDTENFHDILLAMREVLGWEGPLFLAVDEFAAPFHGASEKQNRSMLRHSLAGLYYDVLDAAPSLKKSATDGAFGWIREEYASLFERYCIVSVHDGGDIKNDPEFAYKRRGLIAQSMPAISVVALLNGYAQMSNTAIGRLSLPRMYSRLLHPSQRPEVLSIEQYLFLAEIALTRGHPREVQRVIAAYAAASGDGKFVVPSGDVVANLEGVSCCTRREACKLVAGLRHRCVFAQ